MPFVMVLVCGALFFSPVSLLCEQWFVPRGFIVMILKVVGEGVAGLAGVDMFMACHDDAAGLLVRLQDWAN
jgi:hypothetical protein